MVLGSLARAHIIRNAACGIVIRGLSGEMHLPRFDMFVCMISGEWKRTWKPLIIVLEFIVGKEGIRCMVLEGVANPLNSSNWHKVS